VPVFFFFLPCTNGIILAFRSGHDAETQKVTVGHRVKGAHALRVPRPEDRGRRVLAVLAVDPWKGDRGPKGRHEPRSRPGTGRAGGQAEVGRGPGGRDAFDSK